MATGDYCTLAEIKSRLWPEGTAPDTISDTALSDIITAVSREIDIVCNRRFYTTASDETRYFTTVDSEYLFPDLDIASVTSISIDINAGRTYGTTLATTDYDLYPENAALDSKPYSWIRTSPLGQYGFPTHAKGVKIVGKFGWSAIPKEVNQACLIQTERLWKRKDSPFGMISNPVGGEIRLLVQLDPDVQLMLEGVRKRV